MTFPVEPVFPCRVCLLSKPVSEMTTRKGKPDTVCLDCLCLRRGRARIKQRLPEINLTETQLAYLAGFLDGEGCLVIAKNESAGKSYTWYTGRCDIANTHPCIEEIFHELGIGSLTKRPRRHAHWSDTYIWSFGSLACRALLPRLLPYLRIKRKRAELLLEFFSIMKPKHHGSRLPRAKMAERHSRQKALYEEMRRLNATGPDKHSR
jgi:hypothetical protein